MGESGKAARERLAHRGDEPHLLREIVRTHQALMAGFSRGVGIPASRFTLMRLVATAEKNVGVMDLARQLGVNPAAVTRQIQEMERDGLIRRRADPKDGRRSYVRLSAKGLRTFEDLHDRSHELERALSSVISRGDVDAAVKVLSKLRSFLEERL
jgi:DNA-binding MarR family transcriptional regulator